MREKQRVQNVLLQSEAVGVSEHAEKVLENRTGPFFASASLPHVWTLLPFPTFRHCSTLPTDQSYRILKIRESKQRYSRYIKESLELKDAQSELDNLDSNIKHLEVILMSEIETIGDAHSKMNATNFIFTISDRLGGGRPRIRRSRGADSQPCPCRFASGKGRQN